MKGLIGFFAALMSVTLVLGCGNNNQATGNSESKNIPQKPAQTTAQSASEQKVVKNMPIGSELVIADFDTGEKPNNIGGNFGTWDKEPSDFSQSCQEAFDSVNRYGSNGFSIKLHYDVDSPNPAYNGFWMFLQNTDAAGYGNLAFWVKGDPDKGYTTVFKIELKNSINQIGRYYVNNVTDQWQEIIIPLNQFKGMTDFSSLMEFVIVFEDRVVSNKDGIIYIDNIRFAK